MGVAIIGVSVIRNVSSIVPPLDGGRSKLGDEVTMNFGIMEQRPNIWRVCKAGTVCSGVSSDMISPKWIF